MERMIPSNVAHFPLESNKKKMAQRPQHTAENWTIFLPA